MESKTPHPFDFLRVNHISNGTTKLGIPTRETGTAPNWHCWASRWLFHTQTAVVWLLKNTPQVRNHLVKSSMPLKSKQKQASGIKALTLVFHLHVCLFWIWFLLFCFSSGFLEKQIFRHLCFFGFRKCLFLRKHWKGGFPIQMWPSLSWIQDLEWSRDDWSKRKLVDRRLVMERLVKIQLVKKTTGQNTIGQNTIGQKDN